MPTAAPAASWTTRHIAALSADADRCWQRRWAAERAGNAPAAAHWLAAYDRRMFAVRRLELRAADRVPAGWDRL